ncbi:MAG: hypothetical protein M0005_11705 [Actinomycetota bacterium]|nr:hypothetical protein [Actinomycetota bacterium]
MGTTLLASVRSCGTTTLAVALAATWPARRRVLLVELDPAGGTLAAASGWAAEPSLVSLAAAARRSSDPEAIWAHCQHLPGGAAVLAAPPYPEQARSAAALLTALVGRLGDLDADVLVDAGRLDPQASLPGGAALAGRVVLSVRPRLADLHGLASVLEHRSFFEHRGTNDALVEAGRLGLVSVGDGPYPDGEVAEALGVEVLGRLPWDPQGAELLTALPASDRRLRLSPLVRAARSLAENLAGDGALQPTPSATAEEPAPPGGGIRTRLLRPPRITAALRTGSGVSRNGSASSGEAHL